MKKTRLILMCAAMAVAFCACGGKVKAVKTVDVPSERYSDEEIDEAIETIEEEFDAHWSGCTLRKIYYAGDETSAAHQDWADRNDADEVMVLLSSFDVDASGGNGSLNPNSTYDDWMWILVRRDGGAWEHVDHGY